MTQVIPPGTLYKIHPFDQYSREQNNLWNQLFLIIDQLYLRTGGTVDDSDNQLSEISANENQIALNLALIQQLKQRIEDLENDIQPQIDFSPKWNDITKTSSYIAAPWDDITAKQGITIKLPSQPTPDSVIIVRNGDGSKITIDGNGIKIRRRTSSPTIATVNKGSSLYFRYKIDINEYVL